MQRRTSRCGEINRGGFSICDTPLSSYLCTPYAPPRQQQPTLTTKIELHIDIHNKGQMRVFESALTLAGGLFACRTASAFVAPAASIRQED